MGQVHALEGLKKVPGGWGGPQMAQHYAEQVLKATATGMRCAEGGVLRVPAPRRSAGQCHRPPRHEYSWAGEGRGGGGPLSERRSQTGTVMRAAMWHEISTRNGARGAVRNGRAPSLGRPAAPGCGRDGGLPPHPAPYLASSPPRAWPQASGPQEGVPRGHSHPWCPHHPTVQRRWTWQRSWLPLSSLLPAQYCIARGAVRDEQADQA